MDPINCLSNIPSTAYYIPNFISEDEEKGILHNVYAAPKPKWTQLSNRRLQNWGGLPHVKGMIAEEIPQWLTKYMEKTVEAGAFPEGKLPNHVLVNEYLPGQGIMPHLDGPLFYPTICTITCGSHAVLNFHPEQNTQTDHSNSTSIIASVLLERRSLIVIQDDLYRLYPHSIQEITADKIDKIANSNVCSKSCKSKKPLKRETRISLTIRHVPHTSKFKIKLLK